MYIIQFPSQTTGKSKLPTGLREPLSLDDSGDDDDDANRDEQAFDQLLTISDKSALIPEEEPAVRSWEELKTVCSLAV